MHDLVEKECTERSLTEWVTALGDNVDLHEKLYNKVHQLSYVHLGQKDSLYSKCDAFSAAHWL